MPTELRIVIKQKNLIITHCTTSCPMNKYIFQQTCLDDCPHFTSKIDNGFIKYCTNPSIDELECPSEFCFHDDPYCFNGNCLPSCPEYTVSHNGSCLMSCPNDSPYLTASCEGVCYTETKFCFETCPSSHPYVFSSPKLKHCLVECPSYTAIDGRFCRLSCPDDLPYLFNKTCLEKCPKTHPMISIQTSAFNKMFTCTTYCPKDSASFRNVCVPVCPNGTYFDGLRKKCVKRCGSMRPFIDTTPADRRSIFYQECVSNCPLGKYSLIEKTTLNHRFECVFQCPTPLVHYISKCLPKCYKPRPFILQLNRTCVSSCPMGFTGYNYTCIERCPEHALYIENGTCVSHCANTDSIYILTNIGRKCLSSNFCTNETMLIKGTKTCIQICPRNTHAIIRNVCTKKSECLETNVLQDTNHGYQCQEKCLKGFFRNGNLCVPQCPTNTFIIGKNCTDTCFGTRPLKYTLTSKDKKECVSECPQGYFKYKNECMSLTLCLSYGLQYVYNGTCYKRCPPQTIPNGTNTCIAIDPPKLLEFVKSLVMLAGFFFFIAYLICCYKGCGCFEEGIRRLLHGYQVHIHSQIQ